MTVLCDHCGAMMEITPLEAEYIDHHERRMGERIVVHCEECSLVLRGLVSR